MTPTPQNSLIDALVEKFRNVKPEPWDEGDYFIFDVKKSPLLRRSDAADICYHLNQEWFLDILRTCFTQVHNGAIEAALGEISKLEIKTKVYVGGRPIHDAAHNEALSQSRTLISNLKIK